MIDHKDYKFTPVPWCRPSCPLAWPQRLVYGCLVALHGKPQSVRDLVPLVGLSRPAVTAALNGTPGGRVGLRDHLLVEQTESGWASVEPTGPATEWFVPREGSGDWSRRIAYWPCCVPSDACPLPTAAVGLVWLVAAMERQKRLTTAAGLAQFLGVSSETVAAGIERLASSGVLSWTRGAGGKTRSAATFAEPLPRAWSDWWEPRHTDEQISRNSKRSSAVVAVGPPEQFPIQVAKIERGTVAVPSKVQPAPEGPPAAGKPKHNPAGLTDAALDAWEHNRGCYEAALTAVGIGTGHRMRRQLVEVASQIGEQIGWWSVRSDFVRDADAAHDTRHGPDCSRLLLHRLQERLDGARAERRAQDRKAASKAAAFAPLVEVGMSEQVACPSCGCRQSAEVGYTPEDHWPDEIRLAVEQVQAVAGVTKVQVGTRSQYCRECRRPWPGLILTCRRWADGEVVGGGRTFPDLKPLTDPAGAATEPRPTEVPATDFLDDLGPPPAW